ncbi:thioredoxin family protein [Myroides odoratimimus]|uniref:thioredoxin family protein n=1 Tax=Myroides odoratimimus TaxID=76832 RepID=UPI0025782A93|nr:thioredoxin family protein [Myroides odoratimimus]MDM1039064.1 TM0996/MTH895 family glutaredoxin-like protein [Myroides odoratimimus]MDM1053196.1 TM0996/MTH895 family glutaredoxin-like protein [Myroides odoratimimus]
MKKIKVLGTGCSKCKTMYNNVMQAVKEAGVEVEIEKIEDIQEIMKYNLLSSPALLIDDEVKVKGRVAEVNEIKQFLSV